MSAQTPELINQINNWRMKALNNTLTVEEMRDAIKHLRSDRLEAAKTAGKAKSPPKDTDAMLKELMG